MREALEHLFSALPGATALPPDAARLAARLQDRIRRDLLPRMGASTSALIVGVAGPNNVGKSSLFNALAGASLSPARPEGGLTKQCFAVAHPARWSGDLRRFIEERYDVVLVSAGETPPVTDPGPPGRLYLLLTDSMKDGLLLMDTPDFDSVHQTNRRAAEALLVTVDLVLFVVSRHTYRNAAVVSFLKDVVGAGRPFALIYNEALRPDLAEEHLRQLEQDVGHAPVSRELAVHQPEVEAGRALLSTDALPGATPVKELLADAAAIHRLKAKALAASLSDALREADELADILEASASEPDRLRQRLRRDLVQVGERAAAIAVPADVLLNAFRDELDARSTAHRWMRKGPRLLAQGLTEVGKFIKTQLVGPEPEAPPLDARVRQSLLTGVRELIEALAPEVSAWRGDPETTELLRTTLGADTLSKLTDLPLSLTEDGKDLDKERLYRFCRELLGRELSQSRGEELRQIGATFAYSVPALAGIVGAITVPGITHGADVVFASTLVTTPLLERLVDLLGAGVRDAVAQSWIRSHGQTLAEKLEQGAFGPLLLRLDEYVESSRRHALELRRASAELRAAISAGATEVGA